MAKEHTGRRTSVHLPRPTLERLPSYFRCISRAAEAGEDYISSAAIGKLMNIDEAQVRRDLSLVWGRGRPGVGYGVRELKEGLAQVLGFNNVADAVVVGAGRLGQALFSYSGFWRYGLQIVAVFDKDPDKVGNDIAGGPHGTQPVLDIAKMPDLVKRLYIQLGIVTVPAGQAQTVADLLVSAGIKAIWNFAPLVLDVPDHVAVRNEDLAVGLATLSYHLVRLTELDSSDA